MEFFLVDNCQYDSSDFTNLYLILKYLQYGCFSRSRSHMTLDVNISHLMYGMHQNKLPISV